jgi:hypothetical protein
LLCLLSSPAEGDLGVRVDEGLLVDAPDLLHGAEQARDRRHVWTGERRLMPEEIEHRGIGRTG